MGGNRTPIWIRVLGALVFLGASFLSSASAQPNFSECRHLLSEFLRARYGNVAGLATSASRLVDAHTSVVRGLGIPDEVIEILGSGLYSSLLAPRQTEPSTWMRQMILHKAAPVLEALRANFRFLLGTLHPESDLKSELIGSLEIIDGALKRGNVDYYALEILTRRLAAFHLKAEISEYGGSFGFWQANSEFPLGMLIPTVRALDYWELHKWFTVGAQPLGIIAPQEFADVDGRTYGSSDFTDHDYGHGAIWNDHRSDRGLVGPYFEAGSSDTEDRLPGFWWALEPELIFIHDFEDKRQSISPDEWQLMSIMIHHLSHERGPPLMYYLKKFDKDAFVRIFLNNNDPALQNFQIRLRQVNDYASGFPFALRVSDAEIARLASLLYDWMQEANLKASRKPEGVR